MDSDLKPGGEQSSSKSLDDDKLEKVTGRFSDECMYTLQWSDGYTNRYPFVWLFDHCMCPRCLHPSSKQKIKLMAHIDPEVKPITEKIVDGKVFEVTWRDDHIGRYPSAWLRQHRFDKGTVFDPIADLKMEPWGTELGDEIPRFAYDRVMTDDDALFDWLRALHVTGLALITDAPTECGVVDKLGTRVGYLKEIPFGYSKSTPKVDGSNLGFTSDELGFHGDGPYFAHQAGVLMLHCIHQFRGCGGDNRFADASKAAMILKKSNPHVYKTLTTVPISYRDHGPDCNKFHMIGAKPAIEEDKDGNFVRVFYSDIVRASYMNVPVEKIQDAYRALKALNETFYENAVHFKLKEGDIVTVNNTRVVHGRKGFTVEPSDTGTKRLYEGGYLDWDLIFSRLRVLREEKHGEWKLWNTNTTHWGN